MYVLQKKIIVLSFCLLRILTGEAQEEALDAIQKIYTAYNTKGAIRFTGSIKMYNKNNPGKIIETLEGNYILKGQNFFCRLGPVEMLLNDHYYISVDKSVKIIIIGYRKDLQRTEQSPLLNMGNFKKWIKEKSIVARVVYGGTAPVLKLQDMQGLSGYRNYEITYDAITGYMRKVIIEVSDENAPAVKTMVLETNYSIPVPSEKNGVQFSEKQFFSLTDKKLTVQKIYKTYQLINQL